MEFLPPELVFDILHKSAVLNVLLTLSKSGYVTKCLSWITVCKKWYNIYRSELFIPRLLKNLSLITSELDPNMIPRVAARFLSCGDEFTYSILNHGAHFLGIPLREIHYVGKIDPTAEAVYCFLNEILYQRKSSSKYSAETALRILNKWIKTIDACEIQICSLFFFRKDLFLSICIRYITTDSELTERILHVAVVKTQAHKQFPGFLGILLHFAIENRYLRSLSHILQIYMLLENGTDVISDVCNTLIRGRIIPGEGFRVVFVHIILKPNDLCKVFERLAAGGVLEAMYVLMEDRFLDLQKYPHTLLLACQHLLCNYVFAGDRDILSRTILHGLKQWIGSPTHAFFFRLVKYYVVKTANPEQVLRFFKQKFVINNMTRHALDRIFYDITKEDEALFEEKNLYEIFATWPTFINYDLCEMNFKKRKIDRLAIADQLQRDIQGQDTQLNRKCSFIFL